MSKYCCACGSSVRDGDRYCSACGKMIVDQKKNDVHWPESFDRGNPVALPDEDIDRYVQAVKNNLLSSKDDIDFYFCQSGDTFVWGYKFEEEISIYVTRNYYDLKGYLDEHGNFSEYTEDE